MVDRIEPEPDWGLYQRMFERLDETLIIRNNQTLGQRYGILLKEAEDLGIKNPEIASQKVYTQEDIAGIFFHKFLQVLKSPKDRVSICRELNVANVSKFLDFMLKMYQGEDVLEKTNFLKSVALAFNFAQPDLKAVSKSISLITYLIKFPDDVRLIKDFPNCSNLATRAYGFVRHLLEDKEEKWVGAREFVVGVYKNLYIPESKPEATISNKDVINRLIQLLPQSVIAYASSDVSVVGFSCIGGKMALNDTLFDPDIIMDEQDHTLFSQKLANLIITILHEMAHLIKIEGHSEGDYLKLTPIKFKGESGLYLEEKIFGKISNDRSYSMEMNTQMLKVFFNLEKWSKGNIFEGFELIRSDQAFNKGYSTSFGGYQLPTHSSRVPAYNVSEYLAEKLGESVSKEKFNLDLDF